MLAASNTLLAGRQRKRCTAASRAGPGDAIRKRSRPSVAPVDIEETHRSHPTERPTSQTSPSTCKPLDAATKMLYSSIGAVAINNSDANAGADNFEQIKLPREAMKTRGAADSAQAGALGSSSQSLTVATVLIPQTGTTTSGKKGTAGTRDFPIDLSTEIPSAQSVGAKNCDSKFTALISVLFSVQAARQPRELWRQWDAAEPFFRQSVATVVNSLSNIQSIPLDGHPSSLSKIIIISSPSIQRC